LATLDIPADWLPPTFEGPAVTGIVSAPAAAETGLVQGLPVVGGGGDQAAQAVGVGAVQPGIIALTLGTSGVVFATTESPLVEAEGRLHAFCHAVPDRWHFMGVMLSAAGSLQWYRDTLAPGVSFDTLVNEAGDIKAGSEGLIFLPYLTGERTPYPDPLVRAAWVGLTVRHTRAHMTRAVLEGVAFGIKDSFRLILQAGLGSIEQVRISGGGAKSKLWRQIMADVLGVELVTPTVLPYWPGLAQGPTSMYQLPVKPPSRSLDAPVPHLLPAPIRITIRITVPCILPWRQNIKQWLI
jgi:xylulokinase